MSLQVWLPFTDGTLRQQGSKRVTVSSGGTVSLSNSGKLGKCATFTSTAGGLTIPPAAMTSFTTKCSICFWLKINGWGSSYDTYFQAGTGSTPWAAYIFGFLRNGTNSTICFTIGNGSSASNNSYLSSALSLDTWYHVALTYETGKVKIYLNGNLDHEYTTSIVPAFSSITKISIGRSNSDNNYQTQCNMNDLRIYDDCLSAAEIHNIAQGLVLHYPLNRNGWGNENFILESHKVTGGGNANGITRTYESDGSMKIVSTSGNGNYASLGFAQDSNTSVGNNMAVGDTYCISCDAKIETGTVLPTLFINNGNGYKQLKPVNGSIVTGRWIRVYYSSTWAEPGTQYGNIALHLGFSSAIGTYYFKNFKLEKGSISTPWCPNIADANNAGLNSTTEYDCSGFCNNGTRTGTFSWTSDTPKYTVSQSFNGTDNAITLPSISNILQSPFTMNIWFKKDALGSKSYETLFGGPSGFEMDTRAGAATVLTLYMASTRGGTLYSGFQFGKWYMVTLVNDGTNELYYINEELIKTIEKKAMPTGTYFIGAWASVTSQNYQGQMCDARIYATALSATDILSIYNNDAYIDTNGEIQGKIR